MYNLCIFPNLSLNLPMILTASKNKFKSLFSSSWPLILLSDCMGSLFLCQLLFYAGTLFSLYSTSLVFWVMAKTLTLLLGEGVSSSALTQFGFRLYRCLSLHTTNFHVKGKGRKVCWFQLTSVSKEITFILMFMVYYMRKVSHRALPFYKLMTVPLSVKVTSSSILVGVLGKCHNTGDYEEKRITLSSVTIYTCSHLVLLSSSGLSLG